ncbi:MAG: hypothetical protein SFT68_02495, partial [Rickettsiaceae bacterium]|nr:hypothetical protein [Rickettsiaceae bacterium]
GLSLKSILAISKLVYISGGTDQNWTLEPQDAEFLEKIFSKIEIEDVSNTARFDASLLQDKLQKFISIVKQYEQEIIENPSLIQDMEIFSDDGTYYGAEEEKQNEANNEVNTFPGDMSITGSTEPVTEPVI